MIYDLPSFNFSNLQQSIFVSKLIKNSNSKINLIYSYHQYFWQGPQFIKSLFNESLDDNINHIAYCNNNSGMVLSLLRLGIRKIAFDKKNIKIFEKILNLSEKNNCSLYNFKKFNKKNFIYDLSDNMRFEKNVISTLKKEKFL